MAEDPDDWLDEFEDINVHEAEQNKKTILEIVGADGKAEVIIDIGDIQEISYTLEEALIKIAEDYAPLPEDHE